MGEASEEGTGFTKSPAATPGAGTTSALRLVVAACWNATKWKHLGVKWKPGSSSLFTSPHILCLQSSWGLYVMYKYPLAGTLLEWGFLVPL